MRPNRNSQGWKMRIIYLCKLFGLALSSPNIWSVIFQVLYFLALPFGPSFSGPIYTCSRYCYFVVGHLLLLHNSAPTSVYLLKLCRHLSITAVFDHLTFTAAWWKWSMFLIQTTRSIAVAWQLRRGRSSSSSSKSCRIKPARQAPWGTCQAKPVVAASALWYLRRGNGCRGSASLATTWRADVRQPEEQVFHINRTCWHRIWRHTYTGNDLLPPTRRVLILAANILQRVYIHVWTKSKPRYAKQPTLFSADALQYTVTHSFAVLVAQV